MPTRRDASRDRTSESGRYPAVPPQSRCLYEGCAPGRRLHGVLWRSWDEGLRDVAELHIEVVGEVDEAFEGFVGRLLVSRAVER